MHDMNENIDAKINGMTERILKEIKTKGFEVSEMSQKIKKRS